MKNVLRAIAVLIVGATVLGGSANAGTRHLRIPPPPVPGLRNLPTLRVPVPGRDRRPARTRYVRGRRVGVRRSNTRNSVGARPLCSDPASSSVTVREGLLHCTKS